jgi:hypothetical protein
MSTAAFPRFYRVVCPQCQRVLKFPAGSYMRHGQCPNCKAQVEIPLVSTDAAKSPTTAQLLKHLREIDEPSLDEKQSEQLAMQLSLATCRDFQSGRDLLKNRSLSARQWRRILNSADVREQARVRVTEHLFGGTTAPPGSEPFLLSLASDAQLAADAWKILARYLYFQRHGTCPACRQNPTGLECVYLSFDSFVAAYTIAASRCQHWRQMIQGHLGL